MNREGEKMGKDSKRKQNPEMRVLFEKIRREKFLYNEYENFSIKINSLIKGFFFPIYFQINSLIIKKIFINR